MAQQPDLPGPTTSYSDPIYDRLETVAQRITKRLGLIIFILVAVITAAVVTHSHMRNTPIAASASRFLDAMTTRMEADQSQDQIIRKSKLDEAAKSFAAVADDELVTPYYRARSYIEITQIHLDRGSESDLASAKDTAEKARSWALKAADSDLELAVGLSQTAVLFQSGKYAEAESSYLKIESAAGSKYPDRQIAAILGSAQSMAALGKIDDAIAKLEGVIGRTDTIAARLVEVAKSEYWALKRNKTAPLPASPATPLTTVPPIAEKEAEKVAEKVAEKAAAPVAVPPAIAPVAPALAPAVVVPVAPAPNPEGK